jgi:hypothetical protein
LLSQGRPALPANLNRQRRYLVLPVLLTACQFASTALITPPKTEKEKEEENATAQVHGSILGLRRLPHA